MCVPIPVETNLKLLLPGTNLCIRKRKFASVLVMRWRNSLWRKLMALCAVLVSALFASASIYAATNSATGGFGGINNGTLVGGDGTGRAQIEINSVQLALVKEARDLTGAVLAANADVNPGQEIYFVLYVDNITNFAAYRLTIQDAIDETQFTYVADSLETTSVVSGADAANITQDTRYGFPADIKADRLAVRKGILEAKLKRQVFDAVAVVIDVDFVDCLAVKREVSWSAVGGLNRDVVRDHRHVVFPARLVAFE